MPDEKRIPSKRSRPDRAEKADKSGMTLSREKKETEVSTTDLDKVLAWCRDHDWWDIVQPIVASGYAVEIHVDDFPYALISAENRAEGVEALCLKILRPNIGILVVRPCDRHHFLAHRIGPDEDVDLLATSMMLAENDEHATEDPPKAINEGWD